MSSLRRKVPQDFVDDQILRGLWVLRNGVTGKSRPMQGFGRPKCVSSIRLDCLISPRCCGWSHTAGAVHAITHSCKVLSLRQGCVGPVPIVTKLECTVVPRPTPRDGLSSVLGKFSLSTAGTLISISPLVQLAYRHMSG